VKILMDVTMDNQQETKKITHFNNYKKKNTQKKSETRIYYYKFTNEYKTLDL